MSKSAIKTAQDIQDDIFRRMSASEKIKLTWDFSRHLMMESGKKQRNDLHENINMKYLSWWLSRNTNKSNFNKVCKI
ncbi:hypothetical protein KJ590_00335 [Patescibacteria group bacterium]|nr:hypothetical protein [Patescibacteria group bacterium]MBU4142435.1 hypothetical protein [Patescibacteria group bacterium]